MSKLQRTINELQCAAWHVGKRSAELAAATESGRGIEDAKKLLILAEFCESQLASAVYKAIEKCKDTGPAEQEIDDAEAKFAAMCGR